MQTSTGSFAYPSSSPLTSDTVTCGALATLVGDFAAFQSPPDLSSHFLLAPLQCNDFSVCGNRTTETTDRWLLVDAAGAWVNIQVFSRRFGLRMFPPFTCIHRAATTTGSGCDLIGVSYGGFNGQGSRCGVPPGTCLHYQPDDLYNADAWAQSMGMPICIELFTPLIQCFHHRIAGLPTQYFLSSFAMGGEVIPNLASATAARLAFRTNRFQQFVLCASSIWGILLTYSFSAGLSLPSR